jgi:glycosyltransferase involved in cell wall biosynthesis
VKISVIILSYNSEATLAKTLAAVAELSSDIHVVDSLSSDRTPEIVSQYGAHLSSRPFLNYAAQRNWAIRNLPLKGDWELHLDADERLSDPLVAELTDLMHRGACENVKGYCMPRLVRFMGRPIKHGGMFPIWHMRLFRRGTGYCEEREYDQHFVVNGPTAKLRGWLIDDIRMTLSEWTARHNRWSDAEVRELSRPGRSEVGVNAVIIGGNPLERKRYLRKTYERAPLFFRALGLFGYRYILRCGFLDGIEGLIFFSLQTLWFRFLIDAKLFEERQLDREIPPLEISLEDSSASPADSVHANSACLQQQVLV